MNEPNIGQASEPENAELIAFIKTKPDAGAYAEHVAAHPELIPQLLAIIRTDRGSGKFFCEKTLRKISECRPALV